jgi:hypothetical protein
VAEQVDARDLKSLGASSLYEFKSRPRHQSILNLLTNRFKVMYQDHVDPKQVNPEPEYRFTPTGGG